MSGLTGRSRAETRLRTSQLHFRNAFRNAPIGIALAGLDWRFVEVNRALTQLLGYSEEQLSRTTIRAVTHPDDVEAMLSGSHQLLAGKAARFQAEQRYLHRDGSVGRALGSISLMGEIRGKPLYYFSGMEKIPPRQQNERLRAMPEALTHMLVEAQTLEGASRALLQRLCEELGWQGGELWIRDREDDVLRLQDLWHGLSPELGANVANSVTTHQESDLPSQVCARGEPVWIVDPASNPDVGPAPTATDAGQRGAFGFPILNGGHVIGGAIAEPSADLLAMVKELGGQLGRFIERRRAERAVQVTGEHVRGVLDNVADGIISTDESGVVEFFNRAAQRLFGYSLVGGRGRGAKILIADPYRRDFVSHLNNYLRPAKSQG